MTQRADGTGLIALALALSAAACGPEPLDLPDGCNPLLGGFDCMLPYPTDIFVRPDASMHSGQRVELGSAARLWTDEGRSANVTDWRGADGFSRFPSIVALLGVEVTGSGLVGIFGDYAETEQRSSRTIVLDADTLTFVPHFVDLDPRAVDRERQAIVLRPMVGLEPQRRYIVALQHLEQPNGKAAPAPEGFRRLRDDDVGADEGLVQLRDRYDEEVFPLLEQVGIERADLQLAWDFTTGSEADRIGDMLRARELVLAELEINPPLIESVVMLEDAAGPVWRRIYGKVRGPLVMEHGGPGALLARDAEGRVRLNGTVSIPFSAIIPASVRDSFEPGLQVHYGHGFFGSQDELSEERVGNMAQQLRAVLIAIDWWGMSVNDVGVVVGALAEQVYESMRFSDRVPQGMANWLSLTAALGGALSIEAAFVRPLDPNAPGVVADPAAPGNSNAGALLYELEHPHLLGLSMGHIMGGVYAALNPRIERAVLHVGGAGFTHMMFRSRSFARFLFFMEIALPSPLDQQKLTATMAAHFDRIDPASYARYLLDDELPSGPSGNRSQRSVLMQGVVGDAKVPSFTNALHARLLGIPVLAASARKPFGLPVVDAPHDGSALTHFDLGLDDAFNARPEPPIDDLNEVHDLLRERPEALQQMTRFLHDGIVIDPCGGRCVTGD